VEELVLELRRPQSLTAAARSPYLDNAKLAMMFLVVFGHLSEISFKGAQGQAITVVYGLIYLFHVPAWAFLAGVTSKPGTSIRSALKLVPALAVFQIAYVAITIHRAADIRHWLVTLWWVLWFLLSLIFWKLALPVAVRFRWSIPASFAVAILAGLFGFVGRPLSLSRTLVWFPLFLAGHLFGRQLLHFTASASRIFTFAGAACIYVAGLLMFKWPFPVEDLYEAGSYASMNFHPLGLGMAFRTMHLVSAGILGTCALCLVPRTEHRFTRFGARSLTILLFHPLFIRLIGRCEHQWGTVASIPVLLALALAITFVSGIKPLHSFVQGSCAIPDRLFAARARAWSA
jgi:fucose 4-O-acetylase-like acetyltransferase